jgi:GPH family glycoside/pentoside/hexuronide:cation symporter
MSSQIPLKPTRFSTRWKLLFSAGDLAVSVPLAILMFFQLYFMTDVAGLRPDYAAWAIIAGRVWDAVNDPWFGIVSDRIRSRFGRRRVILLFGAVPLGVGFALMWQVPPLAPLALTVYYGLTFILFNSAFTFIRIGYYAMVPELTGDYDERISINGYLMAYSVGGSLGAVILITVLGWYITDPALLFAAAGSGLGLLIIAPPLLVFRLTRGMLPDLPPDSVSFRSSMADTLSNRPFWWLIGLYSLSWTTAGVIAAALVYFATYYLRVPEQANYFVLVAQGSALLFVPLWVWISKRMDKGRTFIIGSLCWLVVLLAISGLGPQQIALAYLLAAISGAGIANAYVLPWSMIPDVVDYDQLRTDRRREGSYYAFASFFQKMAAGTALWTMGQALAAAGPFNAWLISRGLLTLPLRMERHCANAAALAGFLERHPAVGPVFYPGLASHPQYALAARQMNGFGGMLAFQLKEGLSAAVRMAEKIKVFSYATSLGHPHSLLFYYPTDLYIDQAGYLSPAQKTRIREKWMGEGIVRASVGLEHIDDLIQDLDQALKK